MSALLDANGEMRLVPDEAVETLGDSLPAVLVLLQDPEANAGVLDTLSAMTAQEIATNARRSAGAAKSSRSRYAAETRPKARKLALEAWTRRPGLSKAMVADLVADRLKTDGTEPPSTRTLERWIGDLQPR